MGAVVGEITGANRKAARAAQGAATAQQAEARRQFELAQKSQQQAIAAAESPQQLAALERSIQQQEKGVQREEKFLSSIDPTLVEASQQALRLLRGEEASALGPMKQQRALQRKQLVDQLRSQLGPGAETSSAGIQALTQFDQQTNLGLAQAQQSSLGQLLGSTQQSASQGRSSLANLGQQGLGIASGFGDIAGRKVSAITGGQAGVSAAGQGLVGTAGAQFVGRQVRAQQQQQFGSDLFNVGLIAATGGFGALGGAGGAAAAASPTPGGFTGSVDPSFGNIA